jgi:hypothetical protein
MKTRLGNEALLLRTSHGTLHCCAELVIQIPAAIPPHLELESSGGILS